MIGQRVPADRTVRFPPARLAMIVDLFEFARQSEAVSGSIGWSRLGRVDTPARDGSLAWSARGSMRGRHGGPRLDLAVNGVAILICQRCLQPMSEPVAIDAKFLIAADEDSADALDQDDDYDVVVGSAAFDLDALIEDEVILSLPTASRHAVCPTGAIDDTLRTTRPSPFAVLASLKAGRRTTDGDADG